MLSWPIKRSRRVVCDLPAYVYALCVAKCLRISVLRYIEIYLGLDWFECVTACLDCFACVFHSILSSALSEQEMGAEGVHFSHHVGLGTAHDKETATTPTVSTTTNAQPWVHMFSFFGLCLQRRRFSLSIQSPNPLCIVFGCRLPRLLI